MEKAFEILVEVILFLIASYFLFYKSFLKEMSKQQAKIITTEQLTQIEENVKQDFRTKIESLKADLAKNNISYQISLAKLTKMRFVKIEELVLDFIRLQDFIRENMFWAENDEDFRKNKEKFNELYKKADISRKLCSLYLSEGLINKIIEVLNNSHSAYMSFVKMYHTDPKKLGEISFWDMDAQRIRQKLTSENFKAYEKLNSEIEKFPNVLKDLSNEFKSQVIIKNIEE